MNQREQATSKLSNGAQVITEYVPGAKSTAVGFWANAGSRDEPRDLWGCSHFLEHLLFKGTHRRSAREISHAIESRGGYLNAFTDRDMTCYHAKVTEADLGIAVDVLSDLVQNPLLKGEDVQKELHVILSELHSRDDDPQDLIHDLYAETVWGESGAAHPVIGDEPTLKAMSREMIKEYYESLYAPKRLIVTAAGAIDHDSFFQTLEGVLTLDRPSPEKKRDTPNFVPRQRFIERENNQVQLSLTLEGVPAYEDNRDALNLVSSYLGVGASSSLFQKIREERGLVYGIGTNSMSLSDAGLFSVFAGTLDKNLVEVVDLTLTELESMRDGSSSINLEEVKHKAVGSYLLRSESTDGRMISLGAGYLRTGKIRSLDQHVDALKAVNDGAVREVTRRFERSRTAVTTLGATKATEKKTKVLFKE